MKRKDRELITKAINLLTIYLKGRVISRISLGFIGGGISILGFNNLIPYITVAIRPELVDKITLENDALMYIGFIMIILGSLIPPLMKVFNYYLKLYKEDLKSINKVYSNYDYDSFCSNFSRIGGTFTVFEFELKRMQDFYYFLLDSEFFFHNKIINDNIKKLGNELSDFDDRLSLRVSPAGGASSLYNMPRNHPDYQVESENTLNECKSLIELYQQLKGQFDKFQKRHLLRYFA